MSREMLDRWASAHPRMVAQLGWLYDREAAALARESKAFDDAAKSRRVTREEFAAQVERMRETRRLREIACEFDAATVRADYVGYPFGEEAT